MRLLALVTMFLGWLSLGMAAGVGCPMSTPAPHLAKAAVQHGMAGHMAMMKTTRDAEPKPAPGSHEKSVMPTMPLCPLCLAVVPPLLSDEATKHVFAYPAPSAAKVLADLRSQPRLPPPRLA